MFSPSACLINKITRELDYPVDITPKRVYLGLVIKITWEVDFHVKIKRKKVLHFFLDLFRKSYIFDYLTLKLIF